MSSDAIEKINRQREAEQLLCNKESMEYIKLLIPLIFKSKSKYRFELSVGNSQPETIVTVVAFGDGGRNNFVTIYGFDREKIKQGKMKLIKDMISGKVELDDFSDNKFY